MNEIANLCEIVGANVDNVRRGIGSDTRIGNKFLLAGAGYGGSCFPKDVKALIRTAQQNESSLHILQAVEDANFKQKKVLFEKIKKHYGGELKGKKFALWGLAFKSNTDDMREAPSLVLINQLVEAGVEVVAYDPAAIEECKRKVGNKIQYAQNQYKALEGADALLIVTDWEDFKLPKFTYVEDKLKEKVIFDGRNLYAPELMEEFGYTYYSIGRRDILQ